MSSDEIRVTNNEPQQRYEAKVEGTLAILEYERRGATIALLHTEVPKALEGRGIASVLARAALDEARERGLLVLPYCPFVSAYITRHPDYLPLVAPQFRDRFEATPKPASPGT